VFCNNKNYRKLEESGIKLIELINNKKLFAMEAACHLSCSWYAKKNSLVLCSYD